mgnify:CR=1 FL=1
MPSTETASTDRGEWASMLGMAAMFVGTILLGLVIRPFYDANQLQAFGESGSTQVRFVLLELVMIFIFTAAILFLVRMGAKWVIKYGVMAILALALMYTTVPLAHVLLVDDPGVLPFESEEESRPEGHFVADFGPEHAVFAELDFNDGNWTNIITSVQSGDWANGTTSWTATYPHAPSDDTALNGDFVRATHHPTGTGQEMTLFNGAYVWNINDDGSMNHVFRCFEETLDDESNPITLEIVGCAAAVLGDDDVYVIDAAETLWRYVAVDEGGTVVYRQQAAWQIPAQLDINKGFVHSELLGPDHWMLVSETYALVIELEDVSGGFDEQNNPMSMAKTVMNVDRSGDGDASFTTGHVGASPWYEINDAPEERLIWLGDASGAVQAWTWNTSWSAGVAEPKEESRLRLDDVGGAVVDIVVSDVDSSDTVEVWVLTDEALSMYVRSSLVEYFVVDDLDGITHLAVIAGDEWRIALVSEDGVQTGLVTTDMFLRGEIVFDAMASIIGLAVGLVMMVLLYVHSEWYVVNTVGVLVGAGVITMLGVTFVPPLVIVFMIAAAVYDAWAVYRSRHMLELADTMIGLRLPILLVAPQKRDYSFIQDSEGYGEGQFTEDRPTPPPEAPASTGASSTASTGGRDAMFMGLGDVIFPGMLVLSAVQYLGGTDGLLVGLTTLLGGLAGYAFLMRAVSTGRAQAGLPLLNGGSILGYLVGGLLFVGSSLFAFGISL